MSPRTLVVFFATLVAAAWALQFGAILAVGDFASPAATPWLVATMFLPAIWTFVWLGRDRARWRRLAWGAGRPWMLVVAGLVPAAFALGALALLIALGWASSPMFDFSSGAPVILKGPWKLGFGAQSWPVFAANVALTALLFALVNAIPAAGEEIGWRGLLQGEMIARFGLGRGVALLGLFWALWHLPAIVAGYNFPEHPLLGAFVLFPIQLVADSFVLAWLTIRGRSLWPAALYHGSMNGIQDGVLGSSLLATAPRLQVDLATTALAVALAVVCAWSLARSGHPRPGETR